ncbi:hypothetical protein [Glaciibacter psychrotolerans]
MTPHDTASGGSDSGGTASDGPVVQPTPGSLVVSGGGSTLVGTDTLLAQEAMLRALHEDVLGWRQRLAQVQGLSVVPAPAWTPADPGLEVWAATRALDAVEQRTQELAEALTTAAEGYGQAERAAEMRTRSVGAVSSYLLGRLGQLALLASGPLLAAGSVAVVAAIRARAARGDGIRSVTGSAGSGPAAGSAAGSTSVGSAASRAEQARAITNPYFVSLLRVAVSSLDDAAAGLAGLPLPLAMMLGDEGFGLRGVSGSAAGALALGHPLGVLRETPVAIVPSAVLGPPSPARPPTGLADLASRIPSLSTSGGQVRIERYGDEGAPSWVVYVGGTEEWDAVSADEPWDLTSNVTAVAEQASGSYRAVLEAMRAAGIRPGDPVIEVGHSQGGLIAAQVANSGEFTSVAVVTFGAPSGSVPVSANLPTVAVEHTDDLVPVLGGTTAASAARLVVRREAFATAPLPVGVALPAHGMTAYAETARRIDASPEPRLQSFRGLLAKTVGSDAGAGTLWRGSRVP